MGVYNINKDLSVVEVAVVMEVQDLLVVEVAVVMEVQDLLVVEVAVVMVLKCIVCEKPRGRFPLFTDFRLETGIFQGNGNVDLA